MQHALAGGDAFRLSCRSCDARRPRAARGRSRRARVRRLLGCWRSAAPGRRSPSARGVRSRARAVRGRPPSRGRPRGARPARRCARPCARAGGVRRPGRAAAGVVTLRCGPWRVTHMPLATLAVRAGVAVRGPRSSAPWPRSPDHARPAPRRPPRRARGSAYVDPPALPGPAVAAGALGRRRDGPRPAAATVARARVVRRAAGLARPLALAAGRLRVRRRRPRVRWRRRAARSTGDRARRRSAAACSTAHGLECAARLLACRAAQGAAIADRDRPRSRRADRGAPSAARRRHHARRSSTPTTVSPSAVAGLSCHEVDHADLGEGREARLLRRR